MAKVEDDFLYPLPVGSNAASPDAAAAAAGLRLTNAFDAVLSLYQHAGAIPKQRFNPKEANADNNDNDTASNADEGDASNGAKKKKAAVAKIKKMDPAIKDKWFKYTERVIPGGVMKLVESIYIPTPRGWSTTTAARVNQLFDRRYLIEFEPKEVLQQFTYTELDELRFAYTAIFDLITGGQEAIAKTQVSVAVATSSGLASSSSAGPAAAASSSSAAASASPTSSSPPSFFAAQTAQAAINSKVFESMWDLQGLAKRDIKKNCEPTSSSAAAAAGPSSAAAAASSSSSSAATAAAPVVVAGKQKAGVAKGGTGSSGLVRTDATKERPKLAAEKKHAKALLEDECVKLWPYTPASKSAVFTLSQDPNQPRHKPLYKATVELTAMNKRKVEGPWMGNKKDAEDAAAEVVLKFLYTAAFGKNGK